MSYTVTVLHKGAAHVAQGVDTPRKALESIGLPTDGMIILLKGSPVTLDYTISDHVTIIAERNEKGGQ